MGCGSQQRQDAGQPSLFMCTSACPAACCCACYNMLRLGHQGVRVYAAVLASVGLGTNSAPTIVASMLVAPLMCAPPLTRASRLLLPIAARAGPCGCGVGYVYVVASSNGESAELQGPYHGNVPGDEPATLEAGLAWGLELLDIDGHRCRHRLPGVVPVCLCRLSPQPGTLSQFTMCVCTSHVVSRACC